MSIDLPKPIAAYFAADKSKDGDVATHFTENATVTVIAVNMAGFPLPALTTAMP